MHMSISNVSGDLRGGGVIVLLSCGGWLLASGPCQTLFSY